MKLAWSVLVLGIAFWGSDRSQLPASSFPPAEAGSGKQGAMNRNAPLPPQDELKKLLPDVEGIKRSPRKISKESRERIEKAVERKLDEKEAAPQIWEARASVPEANPNEKVRILYTVVPGKGPKGEFKIGVAVAPDERVVAGARVLENKDDPAIAAEEFLLQFEMFIYTGNLANPASALDEARKQAAGRKDEKAKQLDGIFRLHSLMHPVEAAWTSLQHQLDKDSKDAAADADRLATLFRESEKVLSDFTFLKQSQVDSFRKRLQLSVKELGTLSQHAKAGKMAEARATSAEVYKMSCSQCHAGTQRIFREKRLEFGVGNGYFSVGHDVKTPGDARESYQAAANAVRLAVLLLSEAK